jgi:hypothetical protein
MSHLSRAVGPGGLVLALDVEKNFVAYMRERAVYHKLDNVDIRLVERTSPGLAAGSVDRVLVVDTWHHISDRVAYTRRLVEALGYSGRIVIVEFDASSPIGPPREHRLSPETVVQELAQAGLNATVVAETLPYHYIVIGAVPRD